MEELNKAIASCLRQVLEGRVSWDHLIEEFKKHKDMDIVEVVELMEDMSRKFDRYSKVKDLDEEERKKIEALIDKLERPAGNRHEMPEG